ncbi:hypothetical protein HW130_25540 [Streptomyces sp. PKU-EA00015]|uniref:hypothetical protein n=1 Tax=Streptomyces sp. PKU-EA00015 TaxID=2748326 RepID=UPI0015A21E85|nr:hypothetical protein [Streptomyces sp. PKU-EA00015]NWF29576.1 hypothetical protein [Streptomyces sp. PKU-EA00015]
MPRPLGRVGERKRPDGRTRAPNGAAVRLRPSRSSKLDAIAAALLEQREGEEHKAHGDLRRIIGMDEEI